MCIFGTAESASAHKYRDSKISRIQPYIPTDAPSQIGYANFLRDERDTIASRSHSAEKFAEKSHGQKKIGLEAKKKGLSNHEMLKWVYAFTCISELKHKIQYRRATIMRWENRATTLLQVVVYEGARICIQQQHNQSLLSSFLFFFVMCHAQIVGIIKSEAAARSSSKAARNRIVSPSFTTRWFAHVYHKITAKPILLRKLKYGV